MELTVELTAKDMKFVTIAVMEAQAKHLEELNGLTLAVSGDFTARTGQLVRSDFNIWDHVR